MKKFLKAIIAVPKFLVLGIITFFRFCISPFLPHTCKFVPTCSQYGAQAVRQWGFFVGSYLTFCRLCKCNPFSHGGVDYVPINPRGQYRNLM